MISLSSASLSNNTNLFTELELLNLAILMCLDNNTSGVNNLFYKHGYKIISIDRSVDTSSGTIKYDLCLNSLSKEITLGLEIKGNLASNIDDEQMKRYSKIPIKEYLYQSGIHSVNHDIHQIKTLLMINADRIRETRKKLSSLGYEFSIFGLDSLNMLIKLDEIDYFDKNVYDELLLDPIIS